MRLLDFTRLLVRSVPAIAAAVLLGGAIGLIASRIEAPQYQSTALLLVTAPPQSSAAEGQGANQLAQSRAQLLTQLAVSDQVLIPVQQDLGGAASVEELRRTVTATSVEETNFTSLSASAASPQLAARTVRVISVELQQQAEALDSSVVDGVRRGDIRVDIVSPAEVPDIAFAPQPRNYAIAGAGAGLVLTLAFLLLRDLLARRVWGPDDLHVMTAGSAIVVLLRRPKLRRGAHDRDREAVRLLRNDLLGVPDGPRHVAMVTVGRATGGSLAASLAASLHELDIDAEVIAARTSADVPASSTSLLEGSPAARDFVIVEHETVLGSTTSLLLEPQQFIVILHVVAGRTRYAVAAGAVEQLTRVGGRPRIVVVSEVRRVDAARTIVRTARRLRPNSA